VRDETGFDEAFRVTVGPVWNTQRVGQPQGEHWLNTWFEGHYFQAARLYDVPPWDLLIYYAPRAGTKISVEERPVDAPAQSRLIPTRYTWEGDVQPGTRLQFVQVLLPHAPTPDATGLARSITVLADEPGVAAVKVVNGSLCELAFLNPSGGKLALDTRGSGQLATDAIAGYLRMDGSQVKAALARRGRQLVLGTHEVFRSAKPQDHETGGIN
jgi:hypothetical protein